MTVEELPSPGRWPGGTALILAPCLMLTGVLLRAPYDMWHPTAAGSPLRSLLALAAFTAGTILLWPAVLTLVRRIGAVNSRWARWGGSLAVIGLAARTLHNGVFQVVAASAYRVAALLSVAVLVGWFVLAYGAWRTGVLGSVRAPALACMGVLETTNRPASVIAVVGLAIALVPLGFSVLCGSGRPGRARAGGGRAG